MLTAQKMTNMKNSDRLPKSIHVRSIGFAYDQTASEIRQSLPWAALWVQGGIMGGARFGGGMGRNGAALPMKKPRTMAGLCCAMAGWLFSAVQTASAGRSGSAC